MGLCVCIILIKFLCFFGVSVGVCEILSVLISFCVCLSVFVWL